jgi:2-polyprenyl-3-methyl-5-hydroxy-6-metoxy-1,4-benzoquinol methylase
MPDFKKRSSELELMDYPIEDKSDIFKNFKELVFINRYLGGAIHSYRNIRHLCEKLESPTIVDIGFGAGDLLNYLHEKRKYLPSKTKFIGVDLMPEAKEFADKHYQFKAKQIELVLQDYRAWLEKGERPDIIHASLFCHHLTSDQLIEFLQVASKNAKTGVVINDLQRHALAYYSIKWLTAMFSKSRFTKNDAPLSVLRGFRKKELVELLNQAGISDFDIRWKWAFRYLITIRTNNSKVGARSV